MKPFNLEKAKAGAPVVCQRHTSHYTRARIICFDAFGQRPIIALVKDRDAETETIHWLDLNGVGDFGTLFMAPAKREGWIICRPWLLSSGNYNLEQAYSVIFATEEQAREAFGERLDDYQIARVEWEERNSTIALRG